MRSVENNDLTSSEQQLLDAARRASKTATASYSGFHVGAALRVLTPDGDEVIVTGSNYETIDYNSVCAEKHAVMKAFADHSVIREGELVRPSIVETAVYCATGGEPQQPCGNCRQVLVEVNPNMKIISSAGPRSDAPSGWHDQRVTKTSIKELLPYHFELEPELSHSTPNPTLREPESVKEYVVHFPLPDALETDAESRRQLLNGIEYILLVGSPARARKVITLAHEMFGSATDADSGCYCDLTVEGRNESGREFVLYVIQIPGGPNIAVSSHGIGEAGVEIVLSELPALLAYTAGAHPNIRGVIRAGTRGTMSQVPLGSVALSTRTANDLMDWIGTSSHWQGRLHQAAEAQGMNVIKEGEIDATSWDNAPSTYLIEGSAISTRFFWRNQARPLYSPQKSSPQRTLDAQHRARLKKLMRWTKTGIHWIEMEDYAVHEICAQCGYPSASLGAVIASRRTNSGDFQIDYNKSLYEVSELLPVKLALQAMIFDATDPKG